ncbi:hypothetical protein NF27_DP00600 [Candidatus Jidaibacter acanthamoeba]|uniref:Uncharacterized protein n=1 Tax=Candidatus Jidaibacter acanthamoebae TaxID=86105 RepID=A0A0C1MZM0_9RICK|nr:hypothetical protein [Candidatus Jidaibacter acanthamoeba]KIE05516.1 hypothetical protein NF27_DP00600 [Candidatus Jidaibacter acanthamoeba]
MATVTLFTNLETTPSKFSLLSLKGFWLSLFSITGYFKQKKLSTSGSATNSIASRSNLDKEIPKPLTYGVWYEIYKERNKLEFALDSIYSSNLHNLPFEVKDN